jgi:hypothetical protein
MVTLDVQESHRQLTEPSSRLEDDEQGGGSEGWKPNTTA